MRDTNRLEDFQYWLADMDDALERLIDGLPVAIRKDLDFSPRSLDVLESWILRRFASTEEMLGEREGRIVDGLARYIGETFRRAIGGRWETRFDDPKYAFYGLPQLTDFWDRPTPVCPLALATASADRRTGRLLSDVLLTYVREKQRRGIDPKPTPHPSNSSG